MRGVRDVWVDDEVIDCTTSHNPHTQDLSCCVIGKNSCLLSDYDDDDEDKVKVMLYPVINHTTNMAAAAAVC